MSFAVSLQAEGGQVQVTSVSGTVPDGSFTVSGHADETSGALTSLSVSASVTPKAAT